MRYFLGGWNWIEFISNSMLALCMIIWWVWVRKYADTFDVAIRYNVYQDLGASANYLALGADGDNLSAANKSFKELRDLIDLLNW